MALIPSEPRKRAAILIVVLALGGLYAFWEYWYTPRRAEIETLEARLEQLEDRNRTARVIATRGVDELQGRLATFDRHLRRMETLIPRTEEVPRLLESMALAARQNNLGDLASINPEPAQEGAYYTRTSYEVSVVGAYHNVGRFLTAVASLPRIVTPVDLEMTSRTAQRAGGRTSDEPGQVTARFRIETYILPDPPPPLPDGPSADSVGGGGT